MLSMGSSYPIDTMLVQKPSDVIGTVSYCPATDLHVMHNARDEQDLSKQQAIEISDGFVMPWPKVQAKIV